MIFTTPTFLIFLVLVWSLHWALPRRFQNSIILISSLVFYGWWDWRYLIMLLLIAGTDYLVAHRLQREGNPARRRSLLMISLLTNLGALALFKYFNFFLTSVTGFNPWNIVLPVGISFYTFQALSYTIDVYRRKLDAVESITEYFCFITFFPHMVAGPIQRAIHLLVQFREPRGFCGREAHDGLRQMLWGFFKKMVVANNLSPYVAAMYGSPESATGPELLWATYMFGFEIYCDFSGYTDIAIGCARLFGLSLTQNFAFPYFSESIPEFWQRWHISLTTWFREYVYVPLGGNRVSSFRRDLNISIVFVLSGFWHGANWTFLIWGALHALFYLLDRAIYGMDKASWDLNRPLSLRRLLRMVITFHLVMFAWIFFRADSVTDASLIIQKIGASLISLEFPFPRATISRPSMRPIVWALVMLMAEWFQRRHQHALQIEGWPVWIRWPVYYLIVLIILNFAPLGYEPFIYFQF